MLLFSFREVEKLKEMIEDEKFSGIIEHCTELIKNENTEKSLKDLSLSLRGTFYILNKQQREAMSDLTTLIDDSEVSAKIRANALIKRASLYIQQCKDPQQDPLRAMADFSKAEEIDSENCDIYHHRGQVNSVSYTHLRGPRDS